MKNKILNDKMKKIISFLYESDGMITANEISRGRVTSSNKIAKDKVSYVTTQKYLKLLEEKGVVSVIIEVDHHKRSKKKFSGRGQSKRYMLNPKLALHKYL